MLASNCPSRAIADKRRDGGPDEAAAFRATRRHRDAPADRPFLDRSHGRDGVVAEAA